MFPSPDHRPQPAGRPVWAALRHAADVAIAFLTLESYGLEDLRRSDPASPPGHPRPMCGEPATPWYTGSDPGAAGACPSAPARRPPGPCGAQPLVPGEPPLPADRLTFPSGHRPKLRSRTHTRRPGTTAPAELLCLTPVEDFTAPRRPRSLSPDS